jgi:hypothetical protein
VRAQVLESDEWWLAVETAVDRVGGATCGVTAVGHGRRRVQVRDLPTSGRPVRLVWAERLWSCPNPDCSTRTWSERSELIEARASLTERARREIRRRVGQDGASVAAAALEFGVGWHTAMAAVRERGQRLVDDPGRLGAPSALGLDETAFLAASPTRRAGDDHRVRRSRPSPAPRRGSWPFRTGRARLARPTLGRRARQHHGRGRRPVPRLCDRAHGRADGRDDHGRSLPTPSASPTRASTTSADACNNERRGIEAASRHRFMNSSRAWSASASSGATQRCGHPTRMGRRSSPGRSRTTGSSCISGPAETVLVGLGSGTSPARILGLSLSALDARRSASEDVRLTFCLGGVAGRRHAHRRAISGAEPT